MNKKIMIKLLASMLAFVMTFTNVAMLGSYAHEVFASSNTLEEQDTAVSNSSIEFDAYFEEEGVITHEKDIDVEINEEVLYLSLKVTEGYIASGTVKLEDSNFSLVDTDETLDYIQNINVETNEITLNQINKEESVILEIPIKMNTDSSFNVSNLSKETKVTLTGIYVNNKGKDVDISKEITVKVNMTADMTAELTNSVSKYVQYNVNGEKGVILQQIITSKLTENVLPVKQTKIEIDVPNINGVEPKTVILTSNGTKATNGNTSEVFVENEDYTYEDGKIALTIINEQNENGMISWQKDCQDEIIATYIYSENAITTSASIDISISSEITPYNDETTTANKNISETLALNGQVGDIMSYGVSTNTDTLQKGYMIVSGADNTEYVDTWTANVGYKDLVDSIILENKTAYLDKNSNEYTSNQIYTYTKISQENFLGILGQDGYINICDKEGNIIATLNKDNLEYKYEEETTYIKIETSKPVSEGILNIENGRGIKALEYSKAQEELFTGMKDTISGKVTLNNNEILSGSNSAEITLQAPTEQSTLTLGKSSLSTVTTNEGVELKVTLKTTDESTVLYKNPTIDIVFPKYITNITNANVRLLYEEELQKESAKLYKTENGNIAIKITLSGEQTKFNKAALTEGATLVIQADITANELTPARTENIELYVSNELTGNTVQSTTPVTFVPPAGMVTVNQMTNFSDNGTVATSISGKTETGEIVAKSAAKTATINMMIINNYQYSCGNVEILGRTPFEGNKGIVDGNDLGSTFTAQMVSEIQNKSGLSADQMTVYYSANGEATNDLSNSQNGWTTNFSEVTEIKSFMIVLNNYTLNTGDILTFSYNVQIPENLSYDQATYGTYAVYYIQVEENEGIMTLDLDDETTTSTQVAVAPAVGASTGEGPDLNVELTSDAGDSTEVGAGQVIKYTAKITNKSSNDAKNVKLTIVIPDQAKFITETGETLTDTAQIDVGTIKGASSTEVEFQIRAGGYIDPNEVQIEEEDNKDEPPIDLNNLESLEDYTDVDFDEEDEPYTNEEGKEFYYYYLLRVAAVSTELTEDKFRTNTDYEMYLEAVEEYKNGGSENSEIAGLNKIKVSASATVDGYDDTFTSNVLTNTIVSSKTSVSVNIDAKTSVSGKLTAGQTMSYSANIKSSSTETLKNVVVKCVLPDGIEYLSNETDGVYDENAKTITWNFAELNNQENVSFKCTVSELQGETYSKDLPVTFTVNCDNTTETFKSNTITMTAVKEGFAITQTSNISDDYISSEGSVKYAITVKNLGITSSGVTITDYLPEGLTFESFSYTQNGKTITQTENSGSAVIMSVIVEANETVTIYVTAKADKIGEDETLEVTNKVKLTSGTIDEIWANEITHKIVGSNYNIDDSDSSNGISTKTYKVSGVAWLDANKNGQRDSSEELLSDIKVYLLESETNNVVDSTETNKDGSYTFSKISSGKYAVAFEYDTSKYTITTYNAENIDSSVNSDAVSMLLSINGKTANYAATNTINISSNLYNIDLGLVESPKFDLELTKGVSLIQVSTSKGTDSYKFDNNDLAKVEIPSKTMTGAVVAITYTFTVENTGAVAGYVKKLVDYIPNDLNFSSTLNPEWYQDTDGNLYNTSLANTVINSGEKVEVTLILTKTMTAENTGISSNTAELYETSNDQGITDIDSTPGNKNVSEDDYGKADVIITVKTGGIIMYTGIAIVVLAIFTLRSIRNKEKSVNENIEGKEVKRNER